MVSEVLKKEFANRVTQLMAAKDVDVGRVAAKGQLNPSTIYQWLSAKFMPQGESLRKLAQALDVSTDYLLGGGNYEGFEDREIAVHESFSLYLKSKGITPSHPDYELYERLRDSGNPPTSVEAWENLGTETIPVIRDYDKGRKPSKSARPSSGSKKEPVHKRPDVVVDFRVPKTRPRR